MRARHLLTAVAAAVALVAAAPASAPASAIVYRCGADSENLCGINPDGSGRQQLTNDGTKDFPYVSPSLSRDGSKLAYVFHSELFVMDTSSGSITGPITRSATLSVMRPDGARVAAIDLYPSVMTSVGLDPIACSFAVSGGDRTCTIRTSTLGWTPDGRLLVDRPSHNANETDGVCAVTKNPEAGYDCQPFVAVDPNGDVRDPVVSPDGSVVAATVQEPGTAAGHITLFEYATGEPLRDLTGGTTDGWPAFSPDGERIAFERDGSIYVTSSTGGPGSERRLTAGTMPTWGGAADVPAPAMSGLRVAGTQRGTSVRAQLTIGRADSTLTAVLKAGKATAGSLTRRHVAAGRTTVVVKLSAAWQKRLRSARSLRLKLSVTVTAPGERPVGQTRPVRLRP